MNGSRKSNPKSHLFHIGYTLLVSLSFSHLFHNHFKSPLVIFFQGSPLLTFLGVKIKYTYFQTTFGLPNLTKHLDNPALYQAKHNQPINQQPIHYNNQTKLINHNHNCKNTLKKILYYNIYYSHYLTSDMYMNPS